MIASSRLGRPDLLQWAKLGVIFPGANTSKVFSTQNENSLQGGGMCDGFVAGKKKTASQGQVRILRQDISFARRLVNGALRCNRTTPARREAKWKRAILTLSRSSVWYDGNSKKIYEVPKSSTRMHQQ